MGQDGAPQPTGGAGAPGTGLAPNVAAALSYVPSPITGVIMYFLETNPFVRFHAWQSMFFGLTAIALSQVFSAIVGVLALVPFLGWLIAILSWLLIGAGYSLVAFLVWLVLVVMAFQGSSFHLPVLGALAERYAANDGPNAHGALAYVLGPITGFVLLQRDRDPFVGFHAWQSIILFVAWIVVAIAMGIVLWPLSGFIYYIFDLARIIISLGFLYFWLTALTKAGNGERFQVPYVGPMAERYASR